MDKWSEIDFKKGGIPGIHSRSKEAIRIPVPPSGMIPAGHASADLLLFDCRHIFAGGNSRRPLHWSIPWGDLMMTMFILFAVLYFWHAGNRNDSVVPEGMDTVLEPTNEMSMLTKNKKERINFPQISTLYRMGQEVLKSEHLEGVASVSLVEDKAVKIILTSDILFDSGEAELKGRAVEVLEKVGRVVKEIPYTITIAGHTDNAPINTERFPSNWELSAARACVTARFLIDHMFAPAGQVRVTGYAEFLPVRPNDDVFARALNRRVEIFITKENHHGIPDPVQFNAAGTRQVF